MAHNGKDLWLAAGAHGFIVTSPNGTDWTPQTAAGGFSGAFYGAAYNKKDTWVVVGQSGKIQTSSDGVLWTNRDSKTTSILNGVAFQEGSNAGLVAQGSDYNGTGIIAIGKGNHAYGIEAFGDAYGPGVKSVGGDWGGAGIIAFGGGTGRRSGQNEPNTVCVRTAIGIIAYGAGSSNGVDGYSGPVGDGYGVVGRAMADGNGVVGIAYGKGAGVTGASNRGYGVVAQNTSMPVVRASMHIDPQITLPALADIGDICCVYSVAGVGELYFYDGSAWIKLS